VLHGTVLYYYKTLRAVAPLGTGDLSDDDVFAEDASAEHPAKSAPFLIRFPWRVMYFDAPNEKSRDDWIRMVNVASGRIPPQCSDERNVDACVEYITAEHVEEKGREGGEGKEEQTRDASPSPVAVPPSSSSSSLGGKSPSETEVGGGDGEGKKKSKKKSKKELAREDEERDRREKEEQERKEMEEMERKKTEEQEKRLREKQRKEEEAMEKKKMEELQEKMEQEYKETLREVSIVFICMGDNGWSHLCSFWATKLHADVWVMIFRMQKLLERNPSRRMSSLD
jgi:hypothetical protein